jgi:hypothetical protein
MAVAGFPVARLIYFSGMKKLDERYASVGTALRSGGVKKFELIFRWLPRTIVAKDLRIKVGTFSEMVKDPNKIKIGVLREFAYLLNVDPKIIVDLAYNAAENNDKIRFGKLPDGTTYWAETKH